MGRVRNSKIGGGGFSGKTFGISGIENDKAGATTHNVDMEKSGSGRSGIAGRIGSGKSPKRAARMPHHKSHIRK